MSSNRIQQRMDALSAIGRKALIPISSRSDAERNCARNARDGRSWR